ncbi:hypothetical protein PENSPDRAFT_742281 [Peniophora sp. CONT]|nr:hypothetical protein PENSPDRAFT_742281 [Peniophora sp. CONT]
MSTAAEREQSLLAIGHQCSHVSCNLVDFLPFKCQHCSESFCGEHFKPDQHSCAKYDEFSHNRVAPDCPLCNEPVAIPPGEDPNIRMERHLHTECSVITGKAKSKTPRCASGKCNKVLYAPIHCDKCRLDFCPTHRFPATHNCSSLASTSSSKSASVKPVQRKPGPTPAQAGKKALASAKEGVASVKASTANLNSKVGAMPNPFAAHKVDRSPSQSSSTTNSPMTTHASTTDARSRAELESQRRAMRERDRKGLLSEEEKVILAELEAQHATGRGGGRDKECLIM